MSKIIMPRKKQSRRRTVRPTGPKRRPKTTGETLKDAGKAIKEKVSSAGKRTSDRSAAHGSSWVARTTVRHRADASRMPRAGRS